MIFARDDQVLGKQLSIPKVKIPTIIGADHDFNAFSRTNLLSLIVKLIF